MPKNRSMWMDTFFFTTQSSNSNSAAMAQKFLALVISGEADLMVAPKEAIDYYGSQNMFSDLSKVLPEDLFNYLKNQGLLFEVTYTPTEDEIEDGASEETYYGGIRLDGIDYFSEKGITVDNMCAAVFYSGDHQSMAVDFLNMVFGFEHTDTASETSQSRGMIPGHKMSQNPGPSRAGTAVDPIYEKKFHGAFCCSMKFFYPHKKFYPKATSRIIMITKPTANRWYQCCCVPPRLPRDQFFHNHIKHGACGQKTKDRKDRFDKGCQKDRQHRGYRFYHTGCHTV